MKKVLLKLMAFAACIMLTISPITSVAAENDAAASQEAQSFTGQVMSLSEDTKAYVSPDISSEEKQSFSAGESVFVTKDAEGWYEIFYKGETLYIPKESVKQEDVQEACQQAQELAQEVQEEMDNAEKRDALQIEIYERQNKSQRNAMVWKIIIGALVVAIIALSVIIGLRNKKEDEEKK